MRKASGCPTKLTALALIICAPMCAQAPAAEAQAPSSSGPMTITLQDALQRAAQYGAQIQSAEIAARLAHEDKVQVRAASLPTVNGFNQFIYTEGNGTPSGVFVANDGVHVYNEQLQAHEELLSFVRRGEIRVAAAAEAVARAKTDVAARGLRVTVTQDYYSAAVAARRVANAQQTMSEAEHFLDIAQKQEKGGEVAHSDVIKAQLQLQQRQRDIEDARLALQKAKIALAVLIFPQLNLNYSVVDDLSEVSPLPEAGQAAAQATAGNPDIVAARASVTEAHAGVNVARYGYLPSLSLDVFYGIDANQFSDQTSHATQASGRSTLPNYLVTNRQNLGYSAQATLNIPLWNWGATHSKVKQAELKRDQADLDLTIAQKQLQADLAAANQEAQAAFAQVNSLKSSSELAVESLRLALLRYQAGEATVLDVVDAQTTAHQARGAYDDGLLRYRLAIASLQTLTGKF
jgi:outer membrane protein TolC